MRVFFFGAILGVASSAFAVMPGSATDTHTSDFQFVGRVNGASGVLIGSNMVLTARHVGAGSFTLPGVGTFSVIGGSARHHPTDDLTVFRIDTGATTLTDWAEVNVNSVAASTEVTMVGFGGTGFLNGLGTGYSVIDGGGIRRKGVGTVEGTVFVDEPALRAHSYFAPLRKNGDAALAGGDSGGGWFLNSGSGRKQLVAINSWIGTNGTGSNFMFSNHPDNYFMSGAVDLSRYNGWLREQNVSVVPEPMSLIVVGLGLAHLGRRRKIKVN